MTDAAPRFPPQIRFIIGNEAAERFSFYGMRNILTVFLIDYLLRTARRSRRRARPRPRLFHLFMTGVYFFPLLGGYLADRCLGKYRTILWLSLLYCVGHALPRALRGQRDGFYTGLFLIALGLRRHQALRLVHGGRPVHRDQQAPREEGVRHLLLVHQPRALLRLAPHPKVLEHLGPGWPSASRGC